MLCYVAGRTVELDEGERNAAVRRAQLLLAAGGDPRRQPELHGRAVSAVAADLDSPAARAALQAGLAALEGEAEGLNGLEEPLRLLRRDEGLAWQAYALALLAADLADDG